MAITYEQAMAYLTQKEPEITRQQAERLRDAAQELCDQVAQAAERLAEARAKAEGLARQAGFASLETMVKALGLATIKEQAAEMRQVKAKSIVVRKPYMTLEGDRIYSCASHHAVPPALQSLLNKGYAKTELHYRNIASAAMARGIQLGFDPVLRHQELARLERQ